MSDPFGRWKLRNHLSLTPKYQPRYNERIFISLQAVSLGAAYCHEWIFEYIVYIKNLSVRGSSSSNRIPIRANAALFDTA